MATDINSGSTVRMAIERERLLGQVDENLVDHPSIKLVKRKLDANYQIPIGYDGITSGLEIPNGIELIIPQGSKLTSL